MSANPYIIIIIFSLLIIFSYVYNQIAKLTKIPSVIFLIATGVVIQYILKYLNFQLPSLDGPLRLLGVVGLMMIVLEGALDIKIHREKIRTILAALSTSIIILGITNFLIAGVLYYLNDAQEFLDSFLYAMPLSVVSSAIVIPSVHQLIPAKKEFMILESTLSDIFGIMLFVFWTYKPNPGVSYGEAITWNIILSITLSILFSYLLVWIFQKVKTEIKFFLFLSILALLFSIGEYFHYSALLIILIFGVVLNNTHVFFRGILKKLIVKTDINPIRKEFVLITNETSFLIRTFFFVVFGLTLSLEGLFEPHSLLLAGCVMLCIYLVRVLNLAVFIRSSIFPEMLIAPRGLVTILLFHKIIEKMGVVPFDESILALVIIGTNLMMMTGLMMSGSKEEDVLRMNVGELEHNELDHPEYLEDEGIDEDEK